MFVCVLQASVKLYTNVCYSRQCVAQCHGARALRMSMDTTRVIIVSCCVEPSLCSLIVVCGTMGTFFYSSLWNLVQVLLL